MYLLYKFWSEVHEITLSFLFTDQNVMIDVSPTVNKVLTSLKKKRQNKTKQKYYRAVFSNNRGKY